MSATNDSKQEPSMRLGEPAYAAEYLSACLVEGQEEFLRGLRNVAEACGGINQLAEQTELNRENLYKMLSEEGNPRLSSVLAVADALGVELQLRPRDAS